MASDPAYLPLPDSGDDAGWQRFAAAQDRHDWEATRPDLLLTQVAKVTPEPVTWLWEHRVPEGALVLLDGHPDTGKSTITLDLAARLSTGRRMPDGSRGHRGATLLLSTEDTLAKPVRERLEAAGADLEAVYGLEALDDAVERPLTFPEDATLLHRAILATEARLVVIDPIMGHLSATVSSNSDQDVRRALTPLARTASATGATVLMVRHRRKPDRKNTDVPSWLEGGGSSGGFGIVRAGLMAMRDEDAGVCSLHVTKHNYGRWAPPVDYEFEQSSNNGVGRIRWMPR